MFIDNKPYKALKRHVARHGMDMRQYRGRYGLPVDYPSVSSDYSASRSAMAKSFGLSAPPKGVASEPTVAEQAGGRGRKTAAAK